MSKFLLLCKSLPRTFFLFFDIGRERTVYFLLDSSKIWEGVFLGTNEKATRSTFYEHHKKHQTALDEVKELREAGAGLEVIKDHEYKALDDLLAGYQELLEDALHEILDGAQEAAEKGKPFRLVIFPRLHMNGIPLHAVKIRGKPLINYFDVSYAQTLNLLNHIHGRTESDAISLTIAWNEQDPSTLFFEDIFKSSKQTYKGKCAIKPHPSLQEVLTSVGSETNDILFACHGAYYPDAPATSWL